MAALSISLPAPAIVSRSAVIDASGAPARSLNAVAVSLARPAAARASLAKAENPRSGTLNVSVLNAAANASCATLPAWLAAPANALSMRPRSISGTSLIVAAQPT
ncbi:MAG: hypothetical protein AAFW82_01520 [Pseudomonadota bacterium]